MNGNEGLLNQITDLKLKLRSLFLQNYIEKELFSLTWFVEIAMLVVPLYVWWRLVDRKRLLEICVFGLIANMCASFLDVAGSEYCFWEYPVHPLPQMSLLVPVDYVIVPIVGMLLYQKFSRWRAFLVASVIASALMAFAGEPLAVWIGIYDLIEWNYFYSFLLYPVIYIAAKALTGRFTGIQRSRAG